MKRPKFLLLDEATTGLDTARSVELGKFCRTVADHFVPVVAALLQPPLRSLSHSSLPPSFSKNSPFFYRLYKRFDHILLMNDGRVAYFGPRAKVLEYFEEIGFRCPNWMNPADFLVAVLVRPDDFRVSGDDMNIKMARDFADVYAQVLLFFFFLLFLSFILFISQYLFTPLPSPPCIVIMSSPLSVKTILTESNPKKHPANTSNKRKTTPSAVSEQPSAPFPRIVRRRRRRRMMESKEMMKTWRF